MNPRPFKTIYRRIVARLEMAHPSAPKTTFRLINISRFPSITRRTVTKRLQVCAHGFSVMHGTNHHPVFLATGYRHRPNDYFPKERMVLLAKFVRAITLQKLTRHIGVERCLGVFRNHSKLLHPPCKLFHSRLFAVYRTVTQQHARQQKCYQQPLCEHPHPHII